MMALESIITDSFALWEEAVVYSRSASSCKMSMFKTESLCQCQKSETCML